MRALATLFLLIATQASASMSTVYVNTGPQYGTTDAITFHVDYPDGATRLVGFKPGARSLSGPERVIVKVKPTEFMRVGGRLWWWAMLQASDEHRAELGFDFDDCGGVEASFFCTTSDDEEAGGAPCGAWRGNLALYFE